MRQPIELAAAVVAFCAAGICTSNVQADEVAAFYKGKSITVVVGHEVATGFDIYARALSRHLGRHIPGNPNIVVQNMVGASGMTAANWLHNVAPKDGTVIATISASPIMEPILGNPAARFEPAKFAWIGNMESIAAICGVWSNSGIEKFDDLFVKEGLFGAAGAAGAGAKHPLAIKNILGAKIKLIPGYKGTASIKLAMQRGEVAGLCAIGMSTVTSYWRDDFKSGAFRPILQTGGGAHDLLAGVPHINDYAKSDADRQVFGLIFGTHELGRLYLAPSVVPVARHTALRAAFTATMEDPLFLADAAKTRIDISPMTGQQVEGMMARIASSSPAIVGRAKQAMSAQ